jgi:hypothetical protein
MEPIEEWHIKIFRPGSPTPEIAQTTFTIWRAARRFIDAAQRIYPDSTIQVIVPESAPEVALTELTAMGVRILMNEGD